MSENNKLDNDDKVFSFSFQKKANPEKAGEELVKSSIEIGDDGSSTIIDRFTSMPSSLEEAVNSPKLFKNVKEYISELRRVAGLDMEIEEFLELKKVENRKKNAK
jgi:hypothetical protein